MWNIQLPLLVSVSIFCQTKKTITSMGYGLCATHDSSQVRRVNFVLRAAVWGRAGGGGVVMARVEPFIK